jgi:signal transduction histidine kinase
VNNAMSAPVEGRLSSWMRECGCAGFGGPAGQRFVRQRPWFMASVISVNLAVLSYAGYPGRRLALLLGIAVVPLAIAVGSMVATSSRRLTPGALWLWLIVGSGFITSALATTGGLRSPLLPILVAPVITTVAIWRWTMPAKMIATAFAASAFVLFILPAGVTGPPVPSPYFEPLLVFNLLACVAFGCHSVLAVSEGFASQSRTLESMREQALETASRRVRSLEQVGAKVSHELKNPLAAIKSLLQLELDGFQSSRVPSLRSGPTDERSRKRLEVMTREVARMEGILRDYLGFSRPLEDLWVGAVDLGTVADNVVALLEGRAASTGVRLERTGGSLMLAGDSRRLEEAVLNLAANALEATPRGGKVALEVQRDGHQRVLRIRDTGKGMSPAVLEKLGTPFFTTRAEGTGLGVVLARAVITQHGGRLEFDSVPGAGTTATVTLPETLPTSGTTPKEQVRGPHPAG